MLDNQGSPAAMGSGKTYSVLPGPDPSDPDALAAPAYSMANGVIAFDDQNRSSAPGLQPANEARRLAAPAMMPCYGMFGPQRQSPNGPRKAVNTATRKWTKSAPAKAIDQQLQQMQNPQQERISAQEYMSEPAMVQNLLDIEERLSQWEIMDDQRILFAGSPSNPFGTLSPIILF